MVELQSSLETAVLSRQQLEQKIKAYEEEILANTTKFSEAMATHAELQELMTGLMEQNAKSSTEMEEMVIVCSELRTTLAQKDKEIESLTAESVQLQEQLTVAHTQLLKVS